jgi:GT2 family glycosyltransferase
MTVPICSVIVVNVRSAYHLCRCLQSIIRSKCRSPYELIVVDSLTAPNELEKVKRTFPQLRLVHFERDIGASASHDVGAFHASPSSRFLVFLDSDVVVGRRWLDPLIEVLEENCRCGQVQGKIYMLHEPHRFDSTGHIVDRLGFPRDRGYNEMDTGQYESPSGIHSAKGACFATRKDVYFKVGGYDQDFFVYCDDVDYGWRVNMAGFASLYTPDSIVYHEGGAQAGRGPAVIFHDTKNRYMMLLKNEKSVTRRLFFASLLATKDLRDVLIHLRHRNAELALMKVRGVLWVVKNFRLVEQKRRRYFNQAGSEAMWVCSTAM